MVCLRIGVAKMADILIIIKMSAIFAFLSGFDQSEESCQERRKRGEKIQANLV